MPRKHLPPQNRIENGDGEGNAPDWRAAWVKFVSLLKHSHGPVTTARHIVFLRVCEMAGHFSADELVTGLARGRTRVSRGTVYRTLELMQEAGLVGEVRDSHGQARYEHTFDRPAHARMGESNRVAASCTVHVAYQPILAASPFRLPFFLLFVAFGGRIGKTCSRLSPRDLRVRQRRA